MTYKLAFVNAKAQKEWDDLEFQDRQRFYKKIKKLLPNPRVPANSLSGSQFVDCFKIKFKKPPLRLVYRIDDAAGVFDIVGIGKRDEDVYDLIKERLTALL